MKILKSIAFWAVTLAMAAVAVYAWIDPVQLVQYAQDYLGLTIGPIELPAQVLMTVFAGSLVLVGLVFNKIDDENEERKETRDVQADYAKERQTLEQKNIRAAIDKDVEALQATGPHADIVSEPDLDDADEQEIVAKSAGSAAKPGPVKVVDDKGVSIFRTGDKTRLLLDMEVGELANLLVNADAEAYQAYNKKNGTKIKSIASCMEGDEHYAVLDIFAMKTDVDMIYLGLGASAEPDLVVMQTATGLVIAFYNWDSAGAYFGVKADTVRGWEKRGRIPSKHKMQKFLEA